MCSIIPAVRANISDRIKLLIYFDKNKQASIAPNNSEKPDIAVYIMALFLLLVE